MSEFDVIIVGILGLYMLINAHSHEDAENTFERVMFIVSSVASLVCLAIMLYGCLLF